jgi:glycerate dehydrogenase
MDTERICKFLDRQSIDCDDLDFSAIQSATDFTSYDQCDADAVPDKAGDAEILIVNKVRLHEQQLDKLPNLKLICVIATGTNNIDLDATSARGIVVKNVKDYAAASVSQHVFMLILSLTSQFLRFQKDVQHGAWQAQDQFCLLTYRMHELKDKTLGLIGYGHIAQAVERIAQAFGMNVIIAESQRPGKEAQPDRVPLQQLLSKSDVVSIHCPLTEQTKDLISRAELAMMKPEAILINTARGGIINEADLLQAIETGQIAGAGIDCLVNEPPQQSDPMINSSLAQLIITPHNAWGTLQARQRLVDGTARNIQQYLQDS